MKIKTILYARLADFNGGEKNYNILEGENYNILHF
jgi:hypothetical protein